MKAGDKITTSTGVVLEAKIEERNSLCEGCYFNGDAEECMMLSEGVDELCLDIKGGNRLIFKEQ